MVGGHKLLEHVPHREASDGDRALHAHQCRGVPKIDLSMTWNNNGLFWRDCLCFKFGMGEAPAWLALWRLVRRRHEGWLGVMHCPLTAALLPTHADAYRLHYS